MKTLDYFIRRQAFHMVRIIPLRFEHIDKFILSLCSARLGLGLSLPNHEFGVSLRSDASGIHFQKSTISQTN